MLIAVRRLHTVITTTAFGMSGAEGDLHVVAPALRGQPAKMSLIAVLELPTVTTIVMMARKEIRATTMGIVPPWPLSVPDSPVMTGRSVTHVATIASAPVPL